MTSGEIETTEGNLRSLREIRDSRGWAVVKKAIQDDVLAAAVQMADNPVMSEKEMHFRRGAISAARNSVNVVDLLIAQMENELLLASASAQTQLNLNATA